MQVIYDRGRKTICLSVEELCMASFGAKSIGGYTSGKWRASHSDKTRTLVRAQYEGYEYYSDIELSNTCKYSSENAEFYFEVSGRADGVIIDKDKCIVEQIRVIEKYRFDSESEELCRARLYCYAYFLCRNKELSAVGVRVTTHDASSGNLSHHDREMTVDELRELYEKLLAAAEYRAYLLYDREERRLPTLDRAVFPYKSLRPAQEEMIRECRRDIRHGNRLFCQAPTGIGKTISTIYSAARCLGDGTCDKVFYLTSKSSIRREAISACAKLRGAGAALRTIVINAKEFMCASESARSSGRKLATQCNPELCPYARGYYLRRDAAIYELVENYSEYDRELILSVARKYELCPYELSLDLSELCDVIICDYNYVISPSAYLHRYFDEVKEKYVFLIDEAHNLPSRARDIFSSELLLSDFLSAAPYLREQGEVYEEVSSVVEHFEVFREYCREDGRYDADGKFYGYYISRGLPIDFGEKLSKALKRLEIWVKYNEDSPGIFAVEALVSKIYEYRKICEIYDERYVTFVRFEGDRASVMLYCLDPSHLLSICLDRAVSSVLFSATLTPAEYFADILGGVEKSVSVNFRSPFPSENFLVAVADYISTKYEDREASYGQIVNCIAATLSVHKGNYMVFFPSYDYMEKVYKLFCDKYPKVRTIVQKRRMGYSDREDFLKFFEDDHERLRVGFCVLRGSFSEGIDLPGDRLVGSIIVGVGLPMISGERNMIRDYYDNLSGVGYDYAYTYPGMNSVLQAMGRVIRREDDRGVAVLIDDRYADEKYKELFLKSMKNVKNAGNSKNLAEILRIFWENG